MLSRFRPHVHTMIGFSILLICVDAFILLFRALGLPRGTAIYAGIVSFVVVAFLIARHLIKASDRPDIATTKTAHTEQP
jgi:TRAP-type C4-dicarboxylate transport system permease small subunit